MENNNNSSQREELLEQISALEFVIADLKLFLDTHPCNQEVLKVYGEYVRQSKELREKFTAFYGPLMAETYEPENYWAWIKNPWPWDAN